MLFLKLPVVALVAVGSEVVRASLGIGEMLPLQQALGVADDSSATTTLLAKQVTALGDSYSAGLGALQRLRLCKPGESDASFQCTANHCGKDTGAYPYLWAKKNNLLTNDFKYLVCSGADTKDILKYQVNSPDFGTPQLVTITAGGDDNSAFFNVAEACMFNFGRYNDTVCNGTINSANHTINALLPASLDTLFNALYNKNPRPVVIVMSYVRFWANIDSPDCAWPLNNASPDYKRRMNTLVTDLNAKLKNVSDYYHFRYADVDPKFEDHRVCSQLGPNSLKSWIQMVTKSGFDTDNQFYTELSLGHPTYDGQAKYLEALEEAIGGS